MHTITRRKSENAVQCSIYVSARALEVDLLGTAPPASLTSHLLRLRLRFFRLPVAVAAEYSTKQKIADSHRVVVAAAVVVVFIAMIMIIINAVIIAIAIHLNK